MRTIAYAPDGLRPYAALGHYCRYGTELTERQRELAILVAVKDVTYCWQHHAPLARATGLSDDQIQSIRQGRVPRDLSPADTAACQFAFEVAAFHRAPPYLEEEIQKHFSSRQILDLTLLTSYYLSVAAIAITMDVPIEDPQFLLREQAWQQKYGRF